MTLLNTIYISIGVAVVLFSIITLLINFTRNFFTRSRYVRILIVNDDKSINVKHYKKDTYRTDDTHVLNPDHIFTLKGYATIIFTEHSRENINPLDFESKYDAERFTVAIETKAIQEMFNTLKGNKLDSLKIILVINLMILALIAYLIIKSAGIM